MIDWKWIFNSTLAISKMINNLKKLLGHQAIMWGAKKRDSISPKSRLLNLGCGLTFHDEWDNFDLLPADCRVRHLDLLDKLPFAEGSYSYCYSSHVLEHMPRSYAPDFLREIHRILLPGGVVRIVVPDLEGIVRCYLSELEHALHGDSSAVSRHEWMTMELLDQLTRTFSGGFMGRLWRSRPLRSRSLIEERLGEEASRWLEKFDHEFLGGLPPLLPQQVFEKAAVGPEEEFAFRKRGEIHRWMYDRISLGALLVEAGFRNVRVCGATESSIPDFVTSHLDTDSEGRIRKPDSLFMEGIK